MTSRTAVTAPRLTMFRQPRPQCAAIPQRPLIMLRMFYRCHIEEVLFRQHIVLILAVHSLCGVERIDNDWSCDSEYRHCLNHAELLEDHWAGS
jgi:hypothetical protein